MHEPSEQEIHQAIARAERALADARAQREHQGLPGDIADARTQLEQQLSSEDIAAVEVEAQERLQAIQSGARARSSGSSAGSGLTKSRRSTRMI